MQGRPTVSALYRVGQKSETQTHDHNSVKSEPIYKSFSLEDSLVKSSLKIQPFFGYVAALRCENNNSENKRLTINYNVVY